MRRCPPKAAPPWPLEIGHVLFIDIVGYSKLLINQQSDLLHKLKRIVRATEPFRAADAEGKLISLPTGDGMALVFRNSPEAPAQCALAICEAIKERPDIQLRMGIHSGPVNEVADVNERANITGAGINLAQHVMDCGDAGHILLSKRVADDLEQYPQWRDNLHVLGECEVKHGVVLAVVNLYSDFFGNPALPTRFATAEEAASAALKPPSARRRFPAIAFGILLALLLITLAILAFVFAPAILRQHTRKPPADHLSTSNSTTTIPEKSIAVLPFENRNEEKANAYFADGIQDEILTRLSKIAT